MKFQCWAIVHARGVASQSQGSFSRDRKERVDLRYIQEAKQQNAAGWIEEGRNRNLE